MIPTETRSILHESTGVTDTFPYPFPILSKAHLTVTRIDTDGTEELLTEGADYMVTGVGTVAGGNVILTAGVLAAGWGLRIERTLRYLQETDLRNQGKLRPETLEAMVDAAVMQIQQVRDLLLASLPADDGPASALSWEFTGDGATVTFPLADCPATDDLGFFVQRSGVLLDPSEYAVDAGAETITFASAPAQFDEVTIRTVTVRKRSPRFTTAAKPTASSAWVGEIIRVKDPGQVEFLQVCLEKATPGQFGWVTLGVGDF